MGEANWLVPIRTGFEPNWREFKDWLKGIPGVVAAWEGKKFKGWKVPIDCLNACELKARDLNVTFSYPLVTKCWLKEILADGLYPYQQAAAQLAVQQKRHIFAFEMGLGKTAAAIRAMRGLNVQRALIVTPAIVRQAWLSELDRWWPGHPDARSILFGRARSGLSKRKQSERALGYSSDIQVISYALVGEVATANDSTSLGLIPSYDCIVLDEAHRLKNAKAEQSKIVRAIIAANPQAAVFALTGTLMPDQPKDVWNVLDLLWPERFGKKYKFYSRYVESEEIANEVTGEIYGTRYFGANPLCASELASRLSFVASRVTKHEVAHLLPPFMVSLLKIEGDENYENESKQETFQDWQEAQHSFDSYGQRKIPSVVEWVTTALESGTTHVCVLTHRRETAETIAREVHKACRGGDVRVSEITGDVVPEKRNEELALCRQAKRAVVVATMHSIGIGIDLTFCTQAVFAELYYRPETVLQAIGRFSRLCSKVPSAVYLMVVQGTIDESMAQILLAKIAAINSTMKAGLSEEKFTEALKTTQLSLDELNTIIEKRELAVAYD